MKSWSISLGQWFGINFRLHLTFLFLLVFVWLTQSGNRDPAISLLRSLVFATLVLLAVLLHEAGHLLITWKRSPSPRAIVLLPIGGISIYSDLPGHSAADRQLTEPRREIRAALVGPVTNLLAAAIAGLAISVWLPRAALMRSPLLHLGNLPRTFFWTNIFLAGLNLLPAYPLDGGRVLRTFFASRMETIAATRRAINLGNMFVVLLMFAGLWNTWFMLAGFFLFVGAQLEERTALFQSVLESLRMEEIMLTDFCTLSPADTLEDAISKSVHTLQDDFPVVRGNEMVGVVTRQKILEALRREGNAYVQSVMNKAYEVAGRQDSLATAFRKITARGLTIIPVVDQERLVGIVTLQNLMHSMSVLAESRKLRRMAEDKTF
jgi:Zn-dependent protease/predicted transcriptional regulator